MREFKFRYWDKGRNRWLNDTDEVYMDTSGTAYIEVEGHYSTYLSSRGVERMQYSGLKDKGDNEIFECDLIKCHDHPTGIEDGIYEVIFERGSFKAGNLLLSEWGSAWIEILGNKFQHPELLNPKK